jgi:hypothetical protein
MDDSVQALLFALVFGGAIVWNLLLVDLRSRLKKDHPEAFGALGQPSVWRSSGGRLLGFLWNREYVALKDPGLSRLCDRLRIFFLCLLFLFAVLVVAILSSFGRSQ